MDRSTIKTMERFIQTSQTTSAEFITLTRVCLRCNKSYQLKFLKTIAPDPESEFICRECVDIANDIDSNYNQLKSYKQYYQNRISDLPKKMRDISKMEFDRRLVFKLEKESAYLHGKPGTGKTMTSIAVYQLHISKRKSPVFISYPQFIMQCQSNYSESFESIDDIANTDELVILDDFGAQKMTDYVAQVTYYIVNQREMNDLHTIFTSNYNVKQIDNIIDGRISSRIMGMCNGGKNIIETKGKDRRIKI